MIRLQLADIATLDTQVATHGALRTSEMASDDVFEMLVAIVALIGQANP